MLWDGLCERLSSKYASLKLYSHVVIIKVWTQEVKLGFCEALNVCPEDVWWQVRMCEMFIVAINSASKCGGLSHFSILPHL